MIRKQLFLVGILLTGLSLRGWFFNFKPDLSVCNPSAIITSEPLVTVLLVPFGDARNQGRSLEHQFESSWTMNFVTNLAENLQSLYPRARFIVSHKTGQALQPLQIATMANTLEVDCMVHVSCCKGSSEKPLLYLYNFSYGHDFMQEPPALSWQTMSNAYLSSKKTTKLWSKILHDELVKDAIKRFFLLMALIKCLSSHCLALRLLLLH